MSEIDSIRLEEISFNRWMSDASVSMNEKIHASDLSLAARGVLQSGMRFKAMVDIIFASIGSVVEKAVALRGELGARVPALLEPYRLAQLEDKLGRYIDGGANGVRQRVSRARGGSSSALVMQEAGQRAQVLKHRLKQDLAALPLEVRLGVRQGDGAALPPIKGPNMPAVAAPAQSESRASTSARPFRVFIGSTFEDLQAHRAAVLGALHQLEVAVVGMEYFGANPNDPVEACRAEVARCDAYVGIFAMRYGTVHPAYAKSITELEYEEAQKRALPSLIYLIDEERQPVLPKHVDTGTPAERLRDLKGVLKKQHIVSFFTSPEDLAKRIVLDLPKVAQRIGAEVRQSELERIVSEIPRVAWLTPERLAFLIQEMGPLAAEVANEERLREVLQYLLAGDRQAAVFLLTRTSHPNFRNAIDYAAQVEATLSRLIEPGMRALQSEHAGLDPSSAGEGTPSPKTG